MMDRLRTGSWRRPAFEKDVWEGKAEPETHDPMGIGIEELQAEIEADRRAIERNTARREKLYQEDAMLRERIAANMAKLQKAVAAEQRFHDHGEVDERYLPKGEAQAKKAAREDQKAELDERRAELEAAYGVTISKASRRGEENTFTIVEKAKTPNVEHYKAKMRGLILALARRATLLAHMLPRPRVRLVERRRDLMLAVQDVFASPFLLLAAPKRQDE